MQSYEISPDEIQQYIKKNCKLAYLGAMSGGIPIVKHRAHVDKHMPRS